MLTAEDVSAAAARLAGAVRTTPVIASDWPGVWFKCEYMQHTGSFKARGALNRLLAAREAGELDSTRGVVVASGGNAGIAYAYAARALGVPATVVVPTTAPAAKVERLRTLGADVRLVGTEYAQASEAAQELAGAGGLLYGHAYDQVAMCAGAGTITLELIEQLSTVDTIVVAVGGGGLLAGVATAAAPSTVVGVEPASIPTLHAAMAAGAPVDVDVAGVAADSLGARRIGSIAFEVARDRGVRSVLVEDDAIRDAQRLAWSEYRIVLEPGAAAALAALTSGAYQAGPGEQVAVVLCGANTDPSTIG
jgi:threonine dehydratase